MTGTLSAGGVSTPQNPEEIQSFHRDSEDANRKARLLADCSARVRELSESKADELLMHAVLVTGLENVEFNESAATWFGEAEAWRQTAEEWRLQFVEAEETVEQYRQRLDDAEEAEEALAKGLLELKDDALKLKVKTDTFKYENKQLRSLLLMVLPSFCGLLLYFLYYIWSHP